MIQEETLRTSNRNRGKDERRKRREEKRCLFKTRGKASYFDHCINIRDVYLRWRRKAVIFITALRFPYQVRSNDRPIWDMLKL